MKYLFSLLFFLNALQASVFDDSRKFYSWLDKNEKYFTSCQPMMNKKKIILCDKTIIPLKKIRQLFKISIDEVFEYITSRGVKIEVYCDKKKGPLSQYCSKNQAPKFLRKIHGQYFPEQNKILIFNKVTKGILIHEFIHYLQYKNSSEFDGVVYKKKRIELQNKLNAESEKIIKQVKKLEKNKKKNSKKIAALVKQFKKTVDFVQNFSKWQDLIDEKSIFLIFINFSKTLGISKEDVELAKKNMGFICKRKDVNKKWLGNQCSI